MKKLSITWNDVFDSTGYLFSFAKCLSAALKHSPYADKAENIVASSGFAFRMWAAPELCPSATSIWEFAKQKSWVENGGLSCGYVQRLWNEEAEEQAKREEATELILQSIDRGVAAVVWNIGMPEWGLVAGYDREKRVFYTLDVAGKEGELPFAMLGKGDIPILNVLTVQGKTDKTQEEIMADTKRLAAAHLQGKEWSSGNPKGIAVYSVLEDYLGGSFQPALLWNLTYYLGTYGALKWYAWRFFDRYGETKLADLYHDIWQGWQQAFERLDEEKMGNAAYRSEVRGLLSKAFEKEKEALQLMLSE
jgi:hypothetical protein